MYLLWRHILPSWHIHKAVMRLVLLPSFVMHFPEHRSLFISITARHHTTQDITWPDPAPPASQTTSQCMDHLLQLAVPRFPKRQQQSEITQLHPPQPRLRSWHRHSTQPTTLPLAPHGRYLPCPSPHPGAAQLEPPRDALTRPERPCGAARSFPPSPPRRSRQHGAGGPAAALGTAFP